MARKSTATLPALDLSHALDTLEEAAEDFHDQEIDEIRTSMREKPEVWKLLEGQLKGAETIVARIKELLLKAGKVEPEGEKSLETILASRTQPELLSEYLCRLVPRVRKSFPNVKVKPFRILRTKDELYPALAKHFDLKKDQHFIIKIEGKDGPEAYEKVPHYAVVKDTPAGRESTQPSRVDLLKARNASGAVNTRRAKSPDGGPVMNTTPTSTPVISIPSARPTPEPPPPPPAPSSVATSNPAPFAIPRAPQEATPGGPKPLKPGEPTGRLPGRPAPTPAAQVLGTGGIVKVKKEGKKGEVKVDYRVIRF